MTSPLNKETFVRLLEQDLREVSENAWNELPTQLETFYNIMPSDSAWEEFFSVGAVPDIPAFNGKLTYLSISPGYLTRMEHKPFAGGLLFERELIDDKKYNVLDDQVSALTTSAQRTREIYGVQTFANAFSSTLDFQYSEEGLSLCNSAHTTKSGASTATGFSNTGTSALNATSLNAARLAMRRFKGDIGQRIDVEPTILVVPDTLEQKAREIIGSEKEPGTANNTINTLYNSLQLVVYRRLDDYDTNNWFLVDGAAMKRNLLWFDRIPKETKMTVDFDTFNVKWSIYFRISCGWRDWRWIYGNQVS